MADIADKFNRDQQDIKVAFHAADVLMLSPSTLNKTRLPAAILLPSDKLAVEGFNFTAISPDWISKAVAPEFVNTVTIDGVIKGVPLIGGNQVMLFYNKKLVNEPAESWKDLMAQQQGISQKGAELIGFMCDGPFFILPFLHAFDGGFYQQGVPKLDTQENLNAVSWYQKMWQDGVFYPSCDAAVVQEMFETGKLAYWLSTDSMNFRLQQALGDDLGMATLPSINGNAMGGYFSSIAMAFPEQVFSAEEIQGLRKLTDFMQSFDIQKLIFQTLHQIPVHERMFLSIDLYPSKDFISAYLQLKRNRSMPCDSRLQAIWSELGKELRFFMKGSIPPQKFLSRAQRKIDRKLEKQGL